MMKFILMTLLFLGLMIVSVIYMSGNRPIMEYIPIYQEQDVSQLNWEEIHKLDGFGYVVQEDGHITWHSKKGTVSERLDFSEFMNQNSTRNNDRTNFTFHTPEGGWLILNYPSDTFSNEPTYIINSVRVSQGRWILFILLVILFLYIFGIYLLFHRLSKRLEAKVQEIYNGKEEDKRFFFRGLAHDIKTPLSTIMAYSRAISDGVVAEEDRDKYLTTIYKQSYILKERVDDMTTYANLEENMEDSLVQADLLESIRRYLGENYTCYREKEASIDIGFDDDAKFITSFNPKLLHRLLQNLLTNSIQHNLKGVHIYIHWKPDQKELIIGDNGPGIPEDIQDKMFEPMVTGNQSRTGDHHRGLGLANVRRICQLHGWHISYQGEFRISLS